MNSIVIRAANRDDNSGLLRLTSLISMKGTIGLRIDRNPDFFALLRERGSYHILVAEKQQEILGMIAVAVHEALTIGEPHNIYYISDFKVHPDYQNSLLAYKMVNALLNYLKSVDADILLCTSILGNKKVEPFFRGQLGLSAFTEMGIFSIFQVLPLIWKMGPLHIPQRIQSTESELEELSDFYNIMSVGYSMTPYTKPKDLRNRLNLVIRDNGPIVAAICLADYMHLKQNVVTAMPEMLKIISQTSNFLARFVPFLQLPKEGEAIRLLNLKRMAVMSGKMPELIKLIRYARYLLSQDHFSFLTVALHPSDPLHQVFVKLPKFTTYSKVWMSSLKGNQNLLKALKAGVLVEDYSLV